MCMNWSSGRVLMSKVKGLEWRKLQNYNPHFSIKKTEIDVYELT